MDDKTTFLGASGMLGQVNNSSNKLWHVAENAGFELFGLAISSRGSALNTNVSCR